MWASAYFKYSEFDSPDLVGSGELMDFAFIGKLELVREKCGFPFIITSGYRTAEHNAAVGGKSNSAHLRGLAADVSVSDGPQRFKLVKAALEVGFRRLEIGKLGPGREWVHCDLDPTLPQDTMFLV